VNPMVTAWAGALLRALIGPALTWVALRIGMDQGSVEVATAALVGVLLNIGWVLWVKYRARVQLLTALDMPGGTSEATVQSMARIAPPNVWERL